MQGFCTFPLAPGSGIWRKVAVGSAAAVLFPDGSTQQAAGQEKLTCHSPVAMVNQCGGKMFEIMYI